MPHKPFRVFVIGILLSLGASGLRAERSSCDLRQVDVHPTKAGSYKTYSATGKEIELIFTNEEPDKPADTFPEPPLIVRNLKTGKECQVDGGIWSKNQVYMTSDEGVIGLGCYSGSASWLELYDTGTCRQIASSGNGGVGFSIQGRDRILSSGSCEPNGETSAYCCPSLVQQLTPACELVTLEQESIDLTVKEVGIPMAECGYVLFPRTKKARLKNKPAEAPAHR